MQRPYRDYVAAALIDSQDGTPSVKGCTLFGPPSPRSHKGDDDLIIPAGLVVEKCPPGVARGAFDYANVGGSGRSGRVPARGGAS